MSRDLAQKMVFWEEKLLAEKKQGSTLNLSVNVEPNIMGVMRKNQLDPGEGDQDNLSLDS